MACAKSPSSVGGQPVEPRTVFYSPSFDTLRTNGLGAGMTLHKPRVGPVNRIENEDS